MSTRTLVYWERSVVWGGGSSPQKIVTRAPSPDAVATSLKRTENAAALFTDDDVVVAWRVVRGAKTPVTAPRELRDRAKDLVDARNGCLGVLFDALVSEIDLGFLDAPPASEIAFDAQLAQQTADEFSEAAAKKKRSALADMVGSKWARKLEKTAGSMGKVF